MLNKDKHVNIFLGEELQRNIHNLYDAEYRRKYRVHKQAIKRAENDCILYRTKIWFLQISMLTNKKRFDLETLDSSLSKRCRTKRDWDSRINLLREIINQEAIGIPHIFKNDGPHYLIYNIEVGKRLSIPRIEASRPSRLVRSFDCARIRHYTDLSLEERMRISDITSCLGISSTFEGHFYK